MELWIPYGDVETLLTIQAENLGELVDPKVEERGKDLATQMVQRMKNAEKIFLCDYKSATMKLLKAAFTESSPGDGVRFFSPFAKEIESLVPQLKGKVSKPSQSRQKLREEDGVELSAPPEFLDQTKKLFVATAEPDPLFGVSDAMVAACLLNLANSRRVAYNKRETDEARTLQRSPCYEELSRLSAEIPNADHITITSRGGEAFGLHEDGGVEQVKDDFLTMGTSPAKGLVIAPGGRGYDETLSHSIRLLWGSTAGLRKSGEILLITECREGVGSQALQMFVSGRIDTKGKKQVYVDGIEEVSYVRKLKEEYSVTVLSSLPEVYLQTRLGLRVAKGATEGLNKILTSLGRTSKMHVVTRACETILTRA